MPKKPAKALEYNSKPAQQAKSNGSENAKQGINLDMVDSSSNKDKLDSDFESF